MMLACLSCSGGPAQDAPVDPRLIEENSSLQAFIVLKYMHLSREITRGEGTHLVTFARLAGFDESAINQELDPLRHLLAESNSIYEFAERAAARYHTATQ